MKRTIKILSVFFALSLVLGSMTAFVVAVDSPIEYTLEGIGTDALKNWSFYYTTDSADAADPTANMKPLTKAGRSAADMGSWPFNLGDNAISYDASDWTLGVPGVPIAPNKNNMAETYSIVFFTYDLQ